MLVTLEIDTDLTVADLGSVPWWRSLLAEVSGIFGGFGAVVVRATAVERVLR